MPSYTMDQAREIVGTMLLGAQEEASRIPKIERCQYADLVAGKVHRVWIGGWKPNRMRMVCNAMRQLMRSKDVILEQPPSGQGSTLKVRYYFEQ